MAPRGLRGQAPPAVVPAVDTARHRGWDVWRLASAELIVDVVPGKGGDILGVTWRAAGTNVLWQTPWGLRERGAVSTAAGSVTAFMEAYPGGWQTLFPNVGPACEERGATLGFHGEAALIPWDVVGSGAAGDTAFVEIRTRLVRAPFELRRRVEVCGAQVSVIERVRNVSRERRDALWSHHPAFGPPLLAPGARVETAASWFEVDAERDNPFDDLQPGLRSEWPAGRRRDGSAVDLRVLPGPDAGLERFGYLGGFDRGWAAVTNPSLGLRAELTWDVETFPYAWFWLEAGATPDFPWYGCTYVLGIEPASSYPSLGLAGVRSTTGTHLSFGPGEEREVTVGLRVVAA